MAQRFHRWVVGTPREDQSRQGRKNSFQLDTDFLSPLRGCVLRRTRVPTVETVGYFRSSLRDYLV